MHPVHYDVDYEIERDRLTVFFRLLLAIPWMIVLYVWAALAQIGAIISWFAMLFTKQHPEGIYNFIASYLRFAGRSSSWMLLMTDDWPPFSGQEEPDYPVHVQVDPRAAEYSRAKTFFKIVLFFPQAVLTYGVQILLFGGAFISWWRILFTGKQSATMHDALLTGSAYALKSQAFLLMMTEIHPRVLDVPDQHYPPEAPALPAPSGGPAVGAPLTPQAESSPAAPSDPPPPAAS